MATVYLAEDLKHHRKVAVKVLRPELAAALGAERFLREIEVAARLQHPNILPLLDSGEIGDLCYYVMPYVEGESLRDRLGRGGPLPVGEAVAVLKELADALSHAHAHGVVHRDMKPANILLSGRHALVLDFGVAKAVTTATGQQTLTTSGIAIGTPAYMAPEQAVGDPRQDHRVDIYALGIVAYEILTGRPPFEAVSFQEMVAAQVAGDPTPLARQRAGLPSGLVRVVMKCLAKNPADRWQTADELLAQLELETTPAGGSAAQRARAVMTRRVRALRNSVTPRRAALAAVALVVIAVGVVGARRYARLHWARSVAIPAIERAVSDGAWGRAYDLALEAEEVLPRDSAMDALWAAFSGPTRIESEPAGARVYRRDNMGADTTWRYVGTTPIDSLLLPRSPAYSRLRLVRAGCDTVEDLIAPRDAAWHYVLDSIGTLPPGMVRVAGGSGRLLLWGLDDLALDVPGFLMRRHEVTNREFKAFVDAGGYDRRELWRFPFLADGRELTWEEGMERLRDRTGRPGPATWEVGTYPAGQEHHPVTGVSWYEAAAYAQYADAELPTIFHWAWAARIPYSAGITPLGNIDNRHAGTIAVGSSGAMGGSGLFDMAGNVREWAFNEGSGHERYILGGAWNDAAYGFTSAQSSPPLDRSPANGIRLARIRTADSAVVSLERPVTMPRRDFRSIPPISDSVFAVYRRFYDYDRTPLNAVVEAADSTGRDWVMERITFDAAYGNERVIAYLFLPRNATPPYQTVVLFPGDGGLAVRSSRNLLSMTQVDFVVQGGRALMYPIYKSTYERGDGLASSMPTETNTYSEHVVAWAKDLRRSLDYLATRPELDTTKLAYFGHSWGGRLGGIMLAIEPRFKVAVLDVAGLRAQKAFPEAEPVYFLPRISIPVLMLNGRYDFYFPVESSQNPMFDLLGTPPERKRHVIAEGSHFVPRPVLIRETLDWLDRYLGPVRR